MGRLVFVNGVMDAGKTNALLTRAHGMEEKGYSILTVKSDKDLSTKGKMIKSRAGFEREADIVIGDMTNLCSAVLEIAEDSMIDHVLCEEGQFYTPRQIEQAFELAVEHDIDVTVYGLRSDFQSKAFPASIRLFELAHSIETLDAPCSCKQENAAFNARKVDGQFVFEGEQVAVDNEASVTYESLCPTCYQRERQAAASRLFESTYDSEASVEASTRSLVEARI